MHHLDGLDVETEKAVLRPARQVENLDGKRHLFFEEPGNIASIRPSTRSRVPIGPTMVSGFSRRVSNWLSRRRNGRPPK